MDINNIYSVKMRNLIPDPRSYVRLNPRGWFVQPMISPHRDQVLYWGREEGDGGYRIWRSAADGSERIAMTADNALSYHPFWSADGDRLVFACSDETEGARNWQARKTSRLCIMDSDGKHRQDLTDGLYLDERPCINPRGDTVVFVSNRSGSLSLWSLDLPSGRREQVTGSDSWDYRPVFCPDGSRVAYFTNRAPLKNPTLCILDWRSRKESFPLSPEDFEWVHGPFWLADKNRLLVHAKKDSAVSLWIVDLCNHAVRQLALTGFQKYGHGSLNRAESVMVFDSPENPDA